MSQRVFRRLAAMASVGVLLAAAGCSGSGGVGVTEFDYSIALDESSASAGEVTFDIENTAEQTHQFVVLKTDLAPDALPLTGEGDVDEEGAGIEVIDEVASITGGSSASLPVTLDAGSYVVICNLPGHYAKGMHTGFTVS